MGVGERGGKKWEGDRCGGRLCVDALREAAAAVWNC